MKYLTFPIIILNPGPAHIKDVLSNAMDYCLYCEYLKQEGSHLERSKLAAKELGLRFSGLESAVKNGRCLFDSIPEGSPKTSIDKDRIFDFYKQGRDEFEIVCFLAYAALRSIIQKQSCKKVTNDYLLSRMAGNSKKDEALPEWLKKYQKEYWLNKIKDELQISHWGLKYYSHYTRGFWVSFSMDLEKLTFYAEKQRKEYKIRQLKKLKTEARQAALNALQ